MITNSISLVLLEKHALAFSCQLRLLVRLTTIVLEMLSPIASYASQAMYAQQRPEEPVLRAITQTACLPHALNVLQENIARSLQEIL